MKKNITLLFAILITFGLYGQSPEKMSYQAVVRNASDALITNQTVGMQISIIQGFTNGPSVYTETQTPTTNANGLVSIEIGTGTVVSGIFNTIDWSSGTYYVKTETDVNGGSSYTITGISQLLSVPYALYAKESGRAKNTFTYLGAVRAKNQGTPNPNPNNEIPSNTLTKLRWLGVSDNYASSLGGTNNTEITIPAGVTHIKIYSSIIYEGTPDESKSSILFNKDGSPFTLSNNGYAMYQSFNSKYGFNYTSQYIPVTAGEVFDVSLFQDSPNTLYLSWGSISASISFEFYNRNQ